jgi:hypothetical protein
MTPDDKARLLSDVEKCVKEIARLLPTLIARHSPLAVVIALTLHGNAAMERAVQSGECSPEKAQELLKAMTAMDVDPQRLRMHVPRSQKGSIGRCS